MSVYVDELKDWNKVVGSAAYTGGGQVWCHMTADTEQELYDFATRLRLSRRWVQHVGKPTIHFDLTPGKRAQAVRLGAIERSGRETALATMQKIVPA